MREIFVFMAPILCEWFRFAFILVLFWADFEVHIEKHDQVMEDSRLIQIRVKP